MTPTEALARAPSTYLGMFARARLSSFAALDGHLHHMMDRIPRDGSAVDF